MSSQLTEIAEQYLEMISSRENQTKRKGKVLISVALEEPICWHHLWGYDIRRLFTDPVFYCSETLHQRLWRFHNIPDDTKLDDTLTAWLGHYPEYTYAGMSVDFTSTGVPNIQTDHPLTRQPNLSSLQPVDFLSSGWMPRMIQWYSDIKDHIGDKLQVRFQTWWRGPLDMAVQLRGYENLMWDSVENPEFVDGLLDFLVEQRRNWFGGYCRYFGCDMPEGFLGDDWINVPFITPAFFERFVLPAYLKIERIHGCLRHIHSCGNQTPVQRYLLQIKTLASLEVSPWTDLEQTIKNMPVGMSIGINLHPNDVLFASEGEMKKKLRWIKDTCQGVQYSLATSGLTPINELSCEQAFCRQVQCWLNCAREILE